MANERVTFPLAENFYVVVKTECSKNFIVRKRNFVSLGTLDVFLFCCCVGVVWFGFHLVYWRSSFFGVVGFVCLGFSAIPIHLLP